MATALRICAQLSATIAPVLRRWPRPRLWLCVVAFAAASMSAGCLYRPLYAIRLEDERTTLARELAAVEVGIIANRSGQILRTALERHFSGAGGQVPKRYTLDISLTERRDDWRFLGSDDIRAAFHLTAMARLRDNRAADGDAPTLWQEQVSTVTSYSIGRQRFTAVISEKDAIKRAAEQLADVIATAVASALLQHRQGVLDENHK